MRLRRRWVPKRQARSLKAHEASTNIQQSPSQWEPPKSTTPRLVVVVGALMHIYSPVYLQSPTWYNQGDKHCITYICYTISYSNSRQFNRISVLKSKLFVEDNSACSLKNYAVREHKISISWYFFFLTKSRSLYGKKLGQPFLGIHH